MRLVALFGLGLLTILLPAVVLAAVEASSESNWDETKQSPVAEEWRGLVFTPVKANSGFSFHRQTFLLPASWSDTYNGKQTEIVGQLSFKVRILSTRLYVGYTMISFWQAYDTANSSPFRETNYNPELFYRLTPSNSKFKRWGFDIGGEHNSNGESIDRSRSWNRLYFAPHYRWEKSFIRGKVWYRLPEDDCVPGVEEIECDNNPNITDYYGYGEVSFDMQLGDRKVPPLLHVLAGGSLSDQRGRVEASFSYPAASKDVYYHFWVFYGYGENLIDHDQLRTRVGAGFRFVH